MFWRRKIPTHPTVAAYEAATPRTVSGKTPVTDLRFAVVDAETTGFDFSRDRMLSLALVEVQGGRLRVDRSAAWLVYQPGCSPTTAVNVHGILPSETAGGEPEPAVLLELLPRLQGAVVVGHHVGFDAGMINAALHRHYGVKLRNPLLDTATLARTAIEAFAKTGYPGQRQPDLDELCAQCGIPAVERHTAEGDAYTTALLLLAMLVKLQRRLQRPLVAGDLPLGKS